MKKVLAFVGIAVLMTSVAAADINPSAAKVLNQDGASGVRQNGTLGSISITAVQTGPLQVQLDASVTTAGGDGVPNTVTYNSNTYVLNNQVFLYGQIYDSPWNGGCTFWTTSPGTDWCAIDSQFYMNSPTALGSFALSFTATVPTAMNYQTFAIAYAGLTWITTGYDWFYRTQTVATSAAQTIYIDAAQPTPTPTPPPGATPTPPPGGFGGEPIPTLNWMGILAMIAILGGIAVLVMTRK
jgi:hypothetical protein